MSLYHAFELILVAAAVAGSAYLALSRLAPQLLGRKPATKACTSCNSCSGCASPTSAPSSPQTIRWHR